MHQEDYESMDATLNGIENRFDLNESQVEEFEAWQSWFSIASDLRQSGIYPNALSQVQIDLLEEIAESGFHKVAASAVALLMFNQHGYAYTEVVKPITEYSPRKGRPVKDAGNQIPAFFNLYPNPCNDYITLEWQDLENDNSLLVEITDATGKTVLVHELKGYNQTDLINLTGIKPGVYFVKITDKDTILAYKRITIVR